MMKALYAAAAVSVIAACGLFIFTTLEQRPSEMERFIERAERSLEGSARTLDQANRYFGD